MYEENENKINWGVIIKKAAMVIGVILVILGVVTLVTKCAKKNENKPSLNKPVDLTAQLDALESATLAYLTRDNLPVEINASKTIRLKILINQNLISTIVDSNNNTCDINETYSEVTRLENNYAVKMQVNCGSNKDYRIIYIGCFEECNGGICKGKENSSNGVCSLGNDKNNDKNNNNNSSNNNNNNSTSVNNKPSTSTTKPSTSTTTTKKNSTTTTKPNTTTTTKPTTTKQPTTAKEVWYEYIQCTSQPVCNVGTLVNGRCEKVEFYTAYGTVVKTGTETKPVDAKKVQVSNNTTTVYFNSTSEATKAINAIKNTDLSVTTYTFQGITSKGYAYTKNVKTYKYECTTGTPTNNGKSCLVEGNATYSCTDPTYTYVPSTHTCSRMASKVHYYDPVPGPSTCTTKWSTATSILGWLRTGNTKLQ